jgi:3-oxoacyl-[acyl-carrier protein] reductase
MRTGYPQDIAYTSLFFASDEANWITGQVLTVDGGVDAGTRTLWEYEK